LVEPRTGVQIDPALFRFTDPNTGGQPSPSR
jgi:hypothetical protein